MKKIKTFQTFNEGFDKISLYLQSVLKRGGKFASDVWEATKVEGEETKIAVGILSRMIKGQDVTEKEKQFLKAQSGDIVRILPLVAISGIPIPIPITPLLVMLGKKYGFDFLPKDNRGILKNQVELPEELTLQLVSLPEAGMGYHVVDLILKNDRILTGRKVLNCKYLILHPDESVDTNEIEDIVI
jgi:hypothetical protein